MTTEIKTDPAVRLVEAVTKAGGIVHGGYVRDVLVRKIPRHPESGVDVWVITPELAHAVLTAAAVIGAVTKDGIPLSEIKAADQLAPSKLSMYPMTLYMVDAIPLSLIVKDRLPHGDFDVNMLLYNGVAITDRLPNLGATRAIQSNVATFLPEFTMMVDHAMIKLGPYGWLVVDNLLVKRATRLVARGFKIHERAGVPLRADLVK